MSEIDDLRRRLAAAERVCILFGKTAARGETDRDKALTQAWLEWSREWRAAAPEVTDSEILELAARRDVIRNNTLARLRRQVVDKLEHECRGTVLEALYERQHEPEAYAAHQWGGWRPCDGFPRYEQRDCADPQCRRVQTRHAPEEDGHG